MRSLLAWFDLALALTAFAWIGHELHLILVDRMQSSVAGEAPRLDIDLPNLLLFTAVATISLLNFLALRRHNRER